MSEPNPAAPSTTEPLEVPNPVLDERRARLFVVFTASRSFFGRGIRVLTGYPVSHALLLFRIPGQYFDDPWLVMEAAGQGFIPSAVRSDELPTWQQAYEVLLPGRELRAIANDMKRASGTKYDWAAIRSWIIPSLLNRLSGRRKLWRPKPRGDGQLYCSEITAKLLGRHGFRGIRSEESAPGELAEDVAKSPDAARWEISELVALIGG